MEDYWKWTTVFGAIVGNAAAQVGNCFVALPMWIASMRCLMRLRVFVHYCSVYVAARQGEVRADRVVRNLQWLCLLHCAWARFTCSLLGVKTMAVAHRLLPKECAVHVLDAKARVWQSRCVANTLICV